MAQVSLNYDHEHFTCLACEAGGGGQHLGRETILEDVDSCIIPTGGS